MLKSIYREGKSLSITIAVACEWMYFVDYCYHAIGQVIFDLVFRDCLPYNGSRLLNYIGIMSMNLRKRFVDYPV